MISFSRYALCAILSSISLSFYSCSKSDTEAANELLSSARQALLESRFDDARSLIDSLRSAYPREFDVRRAALPFADSVELEQAKFDLNTADSICTFKQFEMQDLQKNFVLEKNEKYQSQGFFVLPKHAGNKSKYTFFPEVEETGKLLLVTIDKNRKYVFNEAKLDENGIDNFFNEHSELTAENKADAVQCLKLAVAMCELADAKEQKEKMSLKIRFFEEKIKKEKL